MKITNNSQQPQGVHGPDGLVFIQPGQSRDVPLSGASLKAASALSFLTIEGATPAKADPLDHDGDGKPGGAAPNDPPSERDELKKQAAELGIEFAKNISSDKLRALIDAKLAE